MDKLTLRRLTMEQAEQVYTRYMKQDFPRDELKPFAMIREADARGEYECLGCYDGDLLCGYAYLVKLGREYLLDYFAVLADLRGSGYGSRILQVLRGNYADAAAMLIESENPDFAADDDALRERRRRLRFYLHAGCPAARIHRMRSAASTCAFTKVFSQPRAIRKTSRCGERCATAFMCAFNVITAVGPADSAARLQVPAIEAMTTCRRRVTYKCIYVRSFRCCIGCRPCRPCRLAACRSCDI